MCQVRDLLAGSGEPNVSSLQSAQGLRLAGADSAAHFSQRPISWVDLNIVTNSTN